VLGLPSPTHPRHAEVEPLGTVLLQARSPSFTTRFACCFPLWVNYCCVRLTRYRCRCRLRYRPQAASLESDSYTERRLPREPVSRASTGAVLRVTIEWNLNAPTRSCAPPFGAIRARRDRRQELHLPGAQPRDLLVKSHARGDMSIGKFSASMRSASAAISFGSTSESSWTGQLSN